MVGRPARHRVKLAVHVFVFDGVVFFILQIFFNA